MNDFKGRKNVVNELKALTTLSVFLLLTIFWPWLRLGEKIRSQKENLALPEVFVTEGEPVCDSTHPCTWPWDNGGIDSGWTNPNNNTFSITNGKWQWRFNNAAGNWDNNGSPYDVEQVWKTSTNLKAAPDGTWPWAGSGIDAAWSNLSNNTFSITKGKWQWRYNFNNNNWDNNGSPYDVEQVWKTSTNLKPAGTLAVCSSGAKRCAGDQPQVCKSDGTGWQVSDNATVCGLNRACINGSCQAAALSCTSLTPQTPTVQKGQTINYTCRGTVPENGYKASFRVLYRAFGATTFSTLTEVQNVPDSDSTTTTYTGSYNYAVPATSADGDYLVQCRICNASGTSCTGWGTAN